MIHDDNDSSKGVNPDITVTVERAKPQPSRSTQTNNTKDSSEPSHPKKAEPIKPLNVSALRLWIDERFPLANLPAFILLYTTIHCYAQLSHGLPALSFSLMQIDNIIVFVSFFLLMRIVDEHKDFEHDLKHYPERVLQRGAISLIHLRWIGVGALGLQLIHLLTLSIKHHEIGFNPAMQLYMYAWFTLMGVEFFCGKILKLFPLTYAILHMAILPLVVLWVVQMALPGGGYSLSILGLQLFAFFGGLAGEILRKFRAPEELDHYVDAYNHHHRARTLTNLIFLSLCIMSAAQVLLINLIDNKIGEEITLHNSLPFYGVMLVGLIAFFMSKQYYLQSPCIERRKQLSVVTLINLMIGYYVLLGYLTPLIST